MTLDGQIIKEEQSETKRVLPIFFPPPIVTYLYFPYQLSIILAHDKTKPWFFSNFIQLFSKLNSNSIWLLHFFPDIYMVQNNQYFIEVARVNENVVEIKRGEMAKRLCEWIGNGYYVCVILSESALPGSMMYGREPYPHPQFFFGYDLATKTLKLTNFDSHSKYSVIDVGFVDFENALFSDDTARAMETYSAWDHNLPSKYLFFLYKFNDKEHFRYDLDVTKIKESLEDYLQGRDTSYRYKLVNPWMLEYADSQWGVGVYKNLETHLRDGEKKGIDYPAFHGLWEHKKIMTSRLRYLEESGSLDGNEGLAAQYVAVERRANDIRMYVLKCIYSGSPIRTEGIISNINKMGDLETSILSRTCHLLDNYNS